MTTSTRTSDSPSWRWLVGILSGVLFAILSASAALINQTVCSHDKRLNSAEQAIVVMQTDLKYIGSGVDEIKGILKNGRKP